MNYPLGIRAVIFDMDGVLLLSNDLHERAYRQALADVGSVAFNYSSLAGIRTTDAIRAILDQNSVEASDAMVKLLAAKKSRISQELIAQENPVAKGAMGLLLELRQQFALALASSASGRSVAIFIAANGLRSLFDVVLSGADVSAAKPSPEIYLLAATRLHVVPASCLVIEDAVAGVRAAKAAGMTVWAVTSTVSGDLLRSAGADGVFNDLRALMRDRRG